MIDQVLDNPIWHSLVTGHRALSRGGELARRFDRKVSPLMGIREESARAFEELRGLLGDGGPGVLFSRGPLRVPGGLKVIKSMTILQMVCPAPRPGPGAEIVRLGREDVPEMLALTAATGPGPFSEDTIEMGRYYGIRSEDGRLAAMAGERLLLDGYQEVSAVCTDPAFRGKGYAQALVAKVAGQIAAEGRAPFLHVKTQNASAVAAYERVGFETCGETVVTVVVSE